MKIVILEAESLSQNGDIDFSVFEQYGDVTIYQSTSPDMVADRIKDADAVLCNKAPMTGDRLCQAPNLKYIGLFATGYNNIDIDYTRAHGITVCNAGSYSTEAVAQHVFALILHYYNTVTKYDEFVKSSGWINTDKFSPFMEMSELYQKNIGIIGYGSIGQKVAQIAKAFGMNIYVFGRHIQPGNRDGISFTDRDTLLENSDIVTVHCPLNKDSEKMCDSSFFSKMKKDAMFINTSRGGVMDEDALADALNNDIIKNAAVDVVAKEPMSPDCPLLKAKNLTITPHVAWAPLETRIRLVEIVSENLKKWLARTPINVIK